VDRKIPSCARRSRGGVGSTMRVTDGGNAIGTQVGGASSKSDTQGTGNGRSADANTSSMIRNVRCSYSGGMQSCNRTTGTSRGFRTHSTRSNCSTPLPPDRSCNYTSRKANTARGPSMRPQEGRGQRHKPTPSFSWDFYFLCAPHGYSFAPHPALSPSFAKASEGRRGERVCKRISVGMDECERTDRELNRIFHCSPVPLHSAALACPTNPNRVGQRSVQHGSGGFIPRFYAISRD